MTERDDLAVRTPAPPLSGGQPRDRVPWPSIGGWSFVLLIGLVIWWQRERFDSQIWSAFVAVAGATLLDAVCGWAVALRSKRFRWHKLLAFLRANLLPQTMVLFTLVLLAGWWPEARALVLPAAGVMVAAVGIDVKKKLTQLFGTDTLPFSEGRPDDRAPRRAVRRRAARHRRG
jgi:hypothetical protein